MLVLTLTLISTEEDPLAFYIAALKTESAA